ncbi:MAG TPA: hypothetical protein VK204_01940, partial [Nocardioidaceae bacterium]|nr:hypothetical protein [Nocardioidaceae bacterium]
MPTHALVPHARQDSSSTKKRPPSESTTRAFLRSGWLPAALVYALTLFLLREHAHVAGREILTFTVYAAACLTLPGMLVWRLLHRGRERPLLEDIVCGTIVGSAVEVPVYLLGRAVGFPYAAGLFAAAIALASLGFPSGRQLWRTRGRSRPRTHWALHWGLAGVVAYTVAWLARVVWAASPTVGTSLRSPYVDEPFHIALTGELRHHVPSEMPFVDGVPLFYHWFTYAHLASASWLTGLEPVVLLRSVAILLMVVLTVLGVAVASNRLSGRSWPGLAAAVILVVVPTVDVFGWTPWSAGWAGPRFLAQLLYLSPTQTFGTMLSVLAIVLVWELLEKSSARSHGAGWWLLTWLAIGALAGAKSTFLPIFLVGFLGVVAGRLLLQRQLDRAGVILLGGSVVVMLAARTLLYGAGSRSLTLDPFASTVPLAHSLGLAEVTKPVAPLVAAAVFVTYLIARMAAFTGVLGLLSSGGWRTGPALFVVAAGGASVAATFAFDHPGLSQFYFLQSGTTLLVIGAAVGLARLVPEQARAPRLVVPLAVTGALLSGAAVAMLASLFADDTAPSASSTGGTTPLAIVIAPQAFAAVLSAGVVIGFVLVARRVDGLRGWA